MTNLSEFNIKKRKLICDSLVKISDMGFNIIEKVENKTVNVDILTYRDYFERFIFCFDSIKLLLIGYNEKTFSKDFTIALVLRSSLVDFLNVIYLKIYYQEYNPSIQTENNYKTELGKTLCSHLRRVFDRFKKEYLSGNFKEQDYTKTINRFYNDYIFLFDPDMKFDIKDPARNLIFKKEISNKMIIDKISSQSDIRTRNYGRAIGLFELYSKYEHYGILSRRTQRVDVNERFRNILESLELLIEGAIFAISFFRMIIDIKNEETRFRENGSMLIRIIRL